MNARKMFGLILLSLIVALVAVTITLAAESNRRTDETLERIDRKIEMYEAGR